MRATQTFTAGAPQSYFTLELTEDEMRILQIALDNTEIPALPLEDRTKFQDIYAKITLAF